MIDKGICDQDFICNHSNCDCEFDKLYDVGEYLDYKNCKCRKRIVGKLVDEYSENIDGNEMICNGTLNDYGNVCNSCTLYIVLFIIFLIISRSISSEFIYFHWNLKKSNTNIITEATIY